MENRRRMGATLVVASAALLAAACGQSNSGASAPTTTTVGAGQSAPAAPTTTKPYPNLTIDKFPFKDTDGKVYEGKAAFQKSQELTVAKYPTDNPPALLSALESKMTTWGCAAADRQSAQAYANYQSKDGKTTGIEAIATDFYDQAFPSALSTDATFTSMMNDSNITCIGLYNQTRNSPINYKAEFKLIPAGYMRANENGSTIIQYNALEGYSDNLPGGHPSDPHPVRILFRQAPGSDGQPVWKVSKYEDMS